MIKMEHLPRHTTGLLKEVWDRKHRISEITNLNSNGDTARTIKLMLTGLVGMYAMQLNHRCSPAGIQSDLSV